MKTNTKLMVTWENSGSKKNLCHTEETPLTHDAIVELKKEAQYVSISVVRPSDENMDNYIWTIQASIDSLANVWDQDLVLAAHDNKLFKAALAKKTIVDSKLKACFQFCAVIAAGNGATTALKEALARDDQDKKETEVLEYAFYAAMELGAKNLNAVSTLLLKSGLERTKENGEELMLMAIAKGAEPVVKAWCCN